MTVEGEGEPGHCWVVRCGIYFWLPKIQCIPRKWTKRFFKALNLPLWFFCIRVTRVTRGIVSALIVVNTFNIIKKKKLLLKNYILYYCSNHPAGLIEHLCGPYLACVYVWHPCCNTFIFNVSVILKSFCQMFNIVFVTYQNKMLFKSVDV